MKSKGFKIVVLVSAIAVFVASGYVIYRKIKELRNGISQLNQLVQQKEITINTLSGQMQIHQKELYSAREALDSTKKELDNIKIDLDSAKDNTNKALDVVNKLVDVNNKALDIIKKELGTVNKKLDDLTAKQEEKYGDKHALSPAP